MRPFREWQINLLKRLSRVYPTDCCGEIIIIITTQKKWTERSNNRRNHITAQLSSRREITLDPSSQHRTPNHPSDCILKWWNAIILVILFRTPWAEQCNVASATTARSSRADCRCCFCAFSLLHFPSFLIFDELKIKRARNMRGSWWACRVILMSTIKWHFNGETITDIYINKTVQQSHWRPSLSPWYFSFSLNWLVDCCWCAQHFALASSSCDRRHIIRATPHCELMKFLKYSLSVRPSLLHFHSILSLCCAFFICAHSIFAYEKMSLKCHRRRQRRVWRRLVMRIINRPRSRDP